MNLNKLNLLAMAATVLVAGSASGAAADSIECSSTYENGQRTETLLLVVQIPQSADGQATLIRTSASEKRIALALEESRKHELYGPAPTPGGGSFIEGEFTSPSPQGLGDWTLKLNQDGRTGEFDYDDDDGDMTSIPVNCAAR